MIKYNKGRGLMKSYKISYILNMIIFILVIFSLTAMITGLEFLGEGMILSANKIEVFKFFNVDSNILAGIASILFALSDYKVIKGKKNNIKKAYIS